MAVIKKGESGSALLGSQRLGLAVVGFFGCALLYMLRTDLSFAIVCMVNSTATDDDGKHSSACGVATGSNVTKPSEVEGSLQWSKAVQGNALSSFFWGYLISQVPGGYLAGRYGGKMVIFTTLLTSSIFTLISPIAAETNVIFFYFVRIFLGLSQGGWFPSFHAMWSAWAPAFERSKLVAITYAGTQIGNTLVMPISGLLCRYGFAGGWPSLFYILGILGILWSTLWFFYASSTPRTHRFISEAEKDYIEGNMETKSSAGKNIRVPWLEIVKSRAVWALYCGHFAGDWGSYMVVISIPLYMHDILGLELSQMGFIAALPYLAFFVMINVGGVLADKLQSSHVLSTLNVRRLAMIVALGGQAGFLVASGYCGCGMEVYLMVFLVIATGLSGIQFSGFVVNYLDIAPTFSGPLLGIGNMVSCVAGILTPILIGAVTGHGTQSEWQTIFWITAGVQVTGTLIFCLFAKGEIQSWAIIPDDDQQTKSQSNVKVEEGSIKLERKSENAA
ncbi:hypothetical protein AB6A40_004835 [Gnathostoma spinigerum]|uniref:Major facilitator superfamily (MFS) profile domain-containing protein n=1 Tax=Gnathostoma spinigerum TaxID=75299 RepID=A0ABD6EEQ0_9BILA